MLPLIKIRLTYIKRHYWICFFNYFSSGFIMLIIFFKLKSELESSFNSKKNLYEIYSSNILNYPNQKFITDKSYETIGLVLENKKLFDEFNKTYKYKITKDLFYFKNEKEFKKYNDNKKK